MKYIDINQKFTAKVAEYIAKGYTINTATMSGSQGDLPMPVMQQYEVAECWSETYRSIGGICGISIIVTKIKED